jgi:pimeloyl-ACP methyl ester carboxylesterase
MREIIAGMKDRVPGLSRSVFIEECGHWAPQEQPEQVSNALLGFLGELKDLP